MNIPIYGQMTVQSVNDTRRNYKFDVYALQWT